MSKNNPFAFLLCLLIVLFCLEMKASAAEADMTLRIISPKNGDIFHAGEDVDLIFAQSRKTGEAYFSGATGVLPHILFADIPVFSAGRNPSAYSASDGTYRVTLKLRDDIRPGLYPIYVFGRREGVETAQSSEVVVINIGNYAPSLSAIKSERDDYYLKYIGDLGAISVMLFDKYGNVLYPDRKMSLVGEVTDPGVVRFEDGGTIRALKAGNTDVVISIAGVSTTIHVHVTADAPGVRGSFDMDGIVDAHDLRLLREYIENIRGREAVINDAHDLNGDGKVDALDLRVLTTLCARPRCAAQ